MKIFILLPILLISALTPLCSYSSENETAIVIIKARILDEEREIKNICLHLQTWPCTYLDPAKSFSQIKPGRYRLWNIDFTDNELTGRGNLFFDERIKFRFKKNRVYLIGELQLSERRGGKYKMEFKQDASLLLQACRDMPESAHDFPLANAVTGKEIAITCRKVLTSNI